jgi:uncharacterized protein DUF3313
MEGRGTRSAVGTMMAAAFALGLAACAAGQAGKAKPSGFLGDYSKLHAGAEGQALLVYVDPQVHFSKYRKMMIDPVTIWRSAETNDIPRDEAQDLIDDLEDVLRMTLDDNYEIVKQPGPDVIRLRVAITEAEGSWRVVDGRLGDSLDSDLKAVSTKQPSSATRSFVGKAGIEAELLDAASGTRVAAAIDRRVGAHTLKPEESKWEDVEDAFRYWADRLRDRLAELRKRS